VIAESSPVFCECPQPMGFTNHKPQGERYEERKYTEQCSFFLAKFCYFLTKYIEKIAKNILAVNSTNFSLFLLIFDKNFDLKNEKMK
jgi:hypothetical protein